VLRGHTTLISALAVSPDNQLLATADIGGLIRIWDLASGAVGTIRAHERRVHSLHFASDDRLLSADTSEAWVHEALRARLVPAAPAAYRRWLDHATNASIGPGNTLDAPTPEAAGR
jgi:hypothetical protein